MKIFLLLFATLICCLTYGQTKHTVYDESHRPLSFANVMFYTPDSIFITGVVTGEDGAFVVPLVGNNSLVKCSMVGYETKWLKMPLPDTVILKSSSKQLREVTVKSSEPIRIVGSSLLVSVQNSPYQHLGSADELLGKLPSVSVQDGVYSVFGKGTAVIYLNNSRLRDNSELQRLSPADIATVEVIRNPGASYDANIPAVIKIKLKRPKADGMGVRTSVYGRMGRRFSDTETISLTYNTDRLNTFFEASNSSLRLNTDQTNVSDMYTEHGLWKMTSDMPRWKSNYYDYTLSGGIDYQPAKNQSLGTRWSYTDDTSRYGGPTANTMFHDGEMYESLSSFTDSPSGYNQVTGNVFYNGQITSGFDVMFNADFVKKNTDNATSTTESGNKTQEHTNLNTGTADYTLWSAKMVSQWNINKIFQVKLGFDGNIVNQERINSGFENDKIYTSSYLNSRDMNGALFLESNVNLSGLQTTIGLRYEMTNMDYKDIKNSVSLLNKTYHRFYPHLSLSMPVGHVNMSLSYTSTVRRPSFYELRNGSEYFNHYLTTEGNPLLLPQYTSDLSYSVQYQSFIATVGWNRVENYIQSQNKILTANPLNVLRGPVNMRPYNSLYLNLFYGFKVGFWQPSLSMNLIKTYFDINRVSEDIPQLGKKPYMNFFLENWFRLNHDWSLFADIHYSPDGYLREYREHALTTVNVGVIKYFLKKSLYVSLQAFNVFHAKETEISFNPNEVFSKTQFRDNQYVSLRIRYTLRYKNKYKGRSSVESELNRM